jgi:deltex-like protein
VSSVAIPAISSGLHGVGKQNSARLAYQGLMEFDNDLVTNSRLPRNLRDVHFVNIDAATTAVMERVLRSLSDETSKNSPSKRPKNYTPGNITAGIGLGDGASARDTGGCSQPGASPSGSVQPSSAASASGGGADVLGGRMIEVKKERCRICENILTKPMSIGCGHQFCTECIKRCLQKCPVCGQVFGPMRGNQPPGTFAYGSVHPHSCLPGYEKYGTLQITYHFPDGVQTVEHPHPGRPYKGTRRFAYLPDSPEGCEVKNLLQRAFDQRLLFTIGKSLTTGQDDVVVWSDIQQKSKPTGPHGYPDPTYLQRVKDQLAAKGIVPAAATRNK